MKILTVSTDTPAELAKGHPKHRLGATMLSDRELGADELIEIDLTRPETDEPRSEVGRVIRSTQRDDERFEVAIRLLDRSTSAAIRSSSLATQSPSHSSTV